MTTKKNYILSSELAYSNLVLIVKIMVNLLFYHYEGNMHLLYSILVRRELFYKFANTLIQSFSEIEDSFKSANFEITEEWWENVKTSLLSFDIVYIFLF